jgi:restriction endonuclease Mrr
MHAVIRTYSGQGAKELFDLLEERKSDVENVIRAVPGFQAYTLMRTADGGITVTVCQDKAGTDASLQVAREWIQQNAPNIGASPPAVAEGAVILQLG